MSVMRWLKIQHRLWLMLVIGIAGLAIASWFGLSSIRDKMMNEKEIATRHVVESAHSTIAYYHGLAKSGAMGDEEAREAAKAAVGALRYEETNYFWINDMHPRMVMHPMKPDLNGKDLTENADPDGKHLFVEMAKVVEKDGAGFVPYKWPKPGFDEPVAKISFVKGFAPWGWIVGSGVYLDDVEAAYRESASAYVKIGISIVAVMAVVSILIAFSISRPIGKAASAMDDIAEGEGDLTQRLEVAGRDELTHMAQSFNLFVEKIHGLVSEVGNTTNMVASSAEELSTVTRQASAGVAKQRMETDQVATAMTEMSTTAGDVAKNAADAAAAAQSASAEANSGKDVVNQTVEAIGTLSGEVERAAEVIDRLNEDSDNIGKVLDVIKTVAEQTNLLALNATIEAARAGEVGRGFAVVADEVRALANRTQESASEIETLIDRLQTGAAEAVQVMKQGRDLAGQTMSQATTAGQSLGSIADSVTRITDMNTQIAGAAEEQTAVTDDMAKSINHIREISEQSAAGAEETNASSNEMARLAEQLRQMVSTFRV